jgi:hypothetical protein
VCTWGGARLAPIATAPSAVTKGSGGDKVARLGVLARTVASGHFELGWARPVKGRGPVLPRGPYCTSGPTE